MHGQNSPRVPGMEYVEIEPFTWEDAINETTSGTSRVTSGSCSANLYLIITPDSSRAVNAKIRVEGFIIWGLGGFRCYSQSNSTLDLTMGREVTMQYKSDL